MNPSFEVQLKLLDNYRFEVDFGDFGRLQTDEPEPLGDGSGPNPSRLLAAAVANCLCASLLFAVRKYKGQIAQLSAKVEGELERVDGRWRIPKMAVEVLIPADLELPHLDRALEQFEDFCIVTQSVRRGIQVHTRVVDENGRLLHEQAS
jgi:uncharacterized OsmC-like protein